MACSYVALWVFLQIGGPLESTFDHLKETICVDDFGVPQFEKHPCGSILICCVSRLGHDAKVLDRPCTGLPKPVGLRQTDRGGIVIITGPLVMTS